MAVIHLEIKLNMKGTVVRGGQTGFFEDFSVGRVRVGHSRDVLC